MHKMIRYFVLSLLVFVVACSGSTGNEGSDEFDLSLYIFHTNTQTVGGEISWVETYYEKPSGDGPVFFPTKRHLNTGEGIEYRSVNDEVFSRYTITDDLILREAVALASTQVFDRFVSLGDTYTDGGLENSSFKETCIFQNHLDSFDLGTATGDVTLATGVYEDVIQVFCDSTFDTDDGGTRPNYSWDRYYAKGVGLIFLDGTWPNFDLGDIYAIAEY